MQQVTSASPQVLRAYRRDRMIFPIGEDVTGFSLSRASNNHGLEFGGACVNSGDSLAFQLEREAVTRFDARFGKPRLIRQAHAYRLGPY